MDLIDDSRKALDAITRHLARRDHSPHELRTKLARRFTKSAIESALEEARERGWLKEDEELAESWAGILSRKGRSHRYISAYLKKHRLPGVARDTQSELEKCRSLVQTKFGKAGKFDREEQPRVVRFLRYRGFDESVIRKVIYEEP